MQCGMYGLCAYDCISAHDECNIKPSYQQRPCRLNKWFRVERSWKLRKKRQIKEAGDREAH